jgi:hypothetical protein
MFTVRVNVADSDASLAVIVTDLLDAPKTKSSVAAALITPATDI